MNKPIITLLIAALLGGSCWLANRASADDKAEEKAEAEKKPAEPVFQDKNLEKAVRKYVFEKRDNDETITAEDVRDISTIESKAKKGTKDEDKIKDLAGLEKCVSLAMLDLENHNISDLTPLKDLKRLQYLDVKNNKIKDISPLSSVTALQYLQLEDNDVVDIAPVAKLEALNSLYLSRNKIQDISPVAGLKKVWSLYLGGNQISDISPVGKMNWLSSLDLRKNKITDISPLASLADPEFKFLFLDDNDIKDIDTLVQMAKKDDGGDRRFAPFWRVYLSGNPLSDKAKSAQIEELKKLGGRINFKEK